jgi:hypothetical protein
MRETLLMETEETFFSELIAVQMGRNSHGPVTTIEYSKPVNRMTLSEIENLADCMKKTLLFLEKRRCFLLSSSSS